MTTEEDALGRDVSRETRGRLEAYAELLKTWNPKINLVSPATLPDLWGRHIVDSAQIFALAPKTATSWVDLGSGGGFPGLVVAILAAERAPEMRVTLLESDTRKATFLRTVARETGVDATVISKRIEAVDPMGANVVSARALAPLPLLLDYAHRHLGPDGTALLMKGAQWKKEVDNAQKTWRFTHHMHKSKTDPNAVILEIGDLEHV